jgi:hypothetical protein
MTADQVEQEIEGEVFIDLTDDEAAAVGVEPSQEEAAKPSQQDDDDGEQELTPQQLRRRRAKQREREERDLERQENARLRAELDETKRATAHLLAKQAQADVNSADAVYQYAVKEVQEATESGDGARMSLAVQKMIAAQTNRDKIRGGANALIQRGSQPQPVKEGAAPLPRATQAWLARNDWFDGSGDDERSAIALALDKSLARTGEWEPGTPEYFEELDRRIAKRLPEFASNDRGRSSKAPPVSGGTAVSTKRIALDPALVAQMREFGLDPTNKDHVKDVLKNRDAA